MILSLTKMLLQSLDSTHDHSQQVVTYTLPDNREMSIPNPNSSSSSICKCAANNSYNIYIISVHFFIMNIEGFG